MYATRIPRTVRSLCPDPQSRLGLVEDRLQVYIAQRDTGNVSTLYAKSLTLKQVELGCAFDFRVNIGMGNEIACT